MMKRTLMMLLVAIAAMFTTTRAAQVPVCPPDDTDELLAMMDRMTNDEKLDFLVGLLDLGAREAGSNHHIYKDVASNTVVMQFDGDELGVDASDITPEMASLFKPLLFSYLLEGDEDGPDEEFALLMLLAAQTGYNFELKMVNGNNQGNAASFKYSPDEIFEKLGSYLDEDSGGEDDDLALDEDADVDTLIKEIVDHMEEYFQSEPNVDAHIWMDPQANRVVMSMTSNDFAEMMEYREMIQLMKPLFLKTMIEMENGEYNALLFALIASSGRGLQMKLYSPGDKNNPLVIDYSAEELMEILDE